jgi:ribonucleoside-diphosphate reductase alpha chain
MQNATPFLAPISELIWDQKYRLKDAAGAPADRSLGDTFRRVAMAAAEVEKGGRKRREKLAHDFEANIADFGFLPGGRILAGAGTGRAVTLFNCFVMGRIEDDLSSIFENVKEAALTMQQGGGIGHDFSTLRPKGAPVRSIGADASGPVSFMDVWNAMCRTIMSAGARRGAMMGTLRCDHPDIEDFIDAKSTRGQLTNFNLSVLVTDDFMSAVTRDEPWGLVFGGKVYRTVSARGLWERIMRATYDYAEPGVIFIDRINRMNNLAYCEEICATNPCGEQPLPPYGACLLGSINLATLIERPFTSEASIDLGKLEKRVRLAVRFLDNVIGVSKYPLPQQRDEAFAKRRIGLGITGLADALIFSGLRYGTPAAAERARQWMAEIERAAYWASVELAEEKGAFPLFDAEKYLAAPKISGFDKALRKAIVKHGIRNGLLTSIAPTGTISLLAGNVSSGIEPVFDYVTKRRILSPAGEPREETIEDYAHALFRRTFGAGGPLPEAFVHTRDLSPSHHLAMQAAVQAHVDSSISKTINCPETMSFGDFENVYRDAYALGLKGCTTFRPNPVTGAVLVASPEKPAPAAPVPAPPVPAPALHEHLAKEKSASPVIPEPQRAGDVVYMSRPLERDQVLTGFTYKLKWPESEHALYITINDIERDGRRRPFEVFINTKNLEHYAWTVALTRMISAVFRRGGDVTFVAEELKAVFDPQGGRWIGGRYVPSLLAAIGDVIETHMTRIGFIQSPQSLHPETEAPLRKTVAALASGLYSAPQTSRGARHCPRCSSREFERREGCWICNSCGFSRCE